MNYRHSFHAGNSADVVKHSLLIALVRALQLKEGALTLIDTHAGCGLYDLGGEEARRTGEATQGVLRAFAEPNPLLDDYRALGVHRHTVRTRLALAERLLGRDLGAFSTRAELWAALHALDALGGSAR